MFDKTYSPDIASPCLALCPKAIHMGSQPMFDDTPCRPTQTAAPLLTYQQAAKLLATSDRTVWQLVKDQKLPAIRFRGSVRIDPADLRAFIEQAKGRTATLTKSVEGGMP